VYSALIAASHDPKLGSASIYTQLAQVSAQTASLSFSPSSGSYSEGSTFTVNILLNTSAQAAYGVDINKIHFNPAFLQVVKVVAGQAMPLIMVNTVDNGQGTIKFSAVANPGSTYNGTGVVASITFKQISQGPSLVTLDYVPNSSGDSNVAGGAGDILGSVGSATYTGTAPVAPLPPPDPSYT